MSLEEFLASPERPAGTLNRDELEGFLFAMACSPEPVPESDWLAIVFAGRDPAFHTPQEREHVVAAIVRRHREIDLAVITESVAPRFEVRTGDAALENLQPDSRLHRWSRGFFAGHDHLARLWAAHLPPVRTAQLARLVTALTYFADPGLARAAHAEFAGPRDGLQASADAVARALPAAMLEYARLGKALRRTVARFGRPRNAPVERRKVERNSPCPCGSGRKYKHCCLTKDQNR